MVAGEKCERLALEKDEGVKKLVDPTLPSQKEVEDHWVRGHIPYRTCCEVCVRSKGKERDHTSDRGKDRRVPEYSFDYCFLRDELRFKWTMLMGEERISKAVFATAVPHKGSSRRFAKKSA